MTGRVLFSLLVLVLAVPAWADHQAECRLGAQQIERDFALPQVARAIAGKRLEILVVGAGSSLLPGLAHPRDYISG